MKESLIKNLVLGIAVVATTAVQAQDFPSFTEIAYPEGTRTTLFRGNGAWGDYNNDGKMDLVVIGRESGNAGNGWKVSLNLFKNKGDGFELVDHGIPYDKHFNAIVSWIDYNNDGNLDLLYMGGIEKEKSDAEGDLFFELYKNTGVAGGYTLEKVAGFNVPAVYIEQEGCYSSAIAVADFNNDGYQDFAMLGTRNSQDEENKNRYVEIYKNNNGDGTFTKLDKPIDGFADLVKLSNGSLAWGDYDGDGFVDLLVSGWSDTQGSQIKLYHNSGNGEHFEDIVIDKFELRGGEGLAPGVQKGQIAWMDINGDGHLDFMLMGENTNGKAVNLGPSDWVKITDIYINKGLGQENYDVPELYFDRVEGVSAGLPIMKGGAIDFVDFNADGKMDLVINGEGTGAMMCVAMNKGDNTFDTNNLLMEGGRSGAAMQICDFNGDGHADLFGMGYADNNGAQFHIYKNDGNLAVNTAPGIPSGLKLTSENGKTTFSWEAGSDAETPASALRYNIYVKKTNGEILTLVPADLTTGFLKVADCSQALLKTVYTMNLSSSDIEEWGVQTIDQGKMSSAFAKGDNGSSIGQVNFANRVNVSAKDERIHVVTGGMEAEVTVYDVNGRLITKEILKGDGLIKATFNKGVYMVNVKAENNIETQKVVL